MIPRGYTLDRIAGGTGAVTLRFEGQLVFSEAALLWKDLLVHTRSVGAGDRLDLQLSGLSAVDGGSMALLVQIRADLTRRGASSELLGAGPQVQELLHLYRGDVGVGPQPVRRARGVLDSLGAGTLAAFGEVQQVFGFVGTALVAASQVLRNPRSANWAEVAPTMERAGANALPIVILINFLIGLVMAFQGAVQLKQLGANIFVADLVGLSVCRELGPLMTAIILCGRSGASFAAEIGSMKVSEEIDALRTMGFGPLRYLVLPRTVALVLVLPILTLIGDAMGILGGLIVGLLSLDLSITAYLLQTQKALTMWDVFSGVIKSGVFALVIALVACQQGLATTGGAEGVGKRTTSSVVAILFALILADATFTFLFWALGL